MGLTIEDGTGSGNQVEVKDNKLLISGVVASPEHFANHNLGQAFNVNFTATPTIGGCFLYIKNSSKDFSMTIEGISVKLAANDFIDIKLKDSGTPIGGTVIGPVNLNTSSGISADGTFQNGNTITGLTGGLTALKLYHASSLGSVFYNFEQDIVLGSSGVMSLYIGAGTVAIIGTIVMNYHEINN